MLDTFVKQPLFFLQDIASNIHIESNFCIYHPNFQPFALPATVAQRFQQTSTTLKRKYLSLLLRNFLFGIYYSGSLQSFLAVNEDNIDYQLHQNLESNSTFGIDWQFYEQLNEHNHGTGYFDCDWEVLRKEVDGSLAVCKGGLTLHLERDLHLQPNQKNAVVGKSVEIWMPKNRLQNGYYVAVSNVGQEQQNPDVNLGIGRIYLNITPSGAVALMDILTKKLNVAEIPFSFHVLYNPYAYGRYDSGVLYFERENYRIIRDILQEIYRKNNFYFQPEIPLFTKFLAPGLSVAEEPSQKFAAQESFGMNRCQIVANALLSAWEKGENSTEQRLTEIGKHFAQYSIDLQRPYLNPDSEDIYYPLN